MLPGTRSSLVVAILCVWVVTWHMRTMDSASNRIREKPNPVAADAMEAFNHSAFIYLFVFVFHFSCQAQRDEFIRIQASAFFSFLKCYIFDRMVFLVFVMTFFNLFPFVDFSVHDDTTS